MRRAAWILVLIALGVVMLMWLPLKDWLRALLEWTALHRETAWLVYVLVYVVATVCFIPATPLTLAAGAIFGLTSGSLLVSAGSTLGATAAFFIGRGLAREWVGSRIAAWPRFRALDAAVGQRGFLIVLLTRLSPAFPFFLLNYAYGLSAVRPRDYILASWLGMMPATVAYVYIGTLAANIAQVLSGETATSAQSSPLRWALLACGLIATIAVTVVITRLAGRQLDSQLGDAPVPSAATQEPRP